MTINEISRIYGVDIKNLRKITENGLLDKFDFEKENTKKINLIVLLSKIGVSADDIKKIINIENKEEKIRIIRRYRFELVDEIHIKQQLLDQLDYCVHEIKNN